MPKDDSAPDATGGPAVARRRRAHLPGGGKFWFVLLLALALGAWGARWVHQRMTNVYIDDARIDGEVVTLSSRVSGWITELPVIEGDPIARGQVLARIDDRDSRLQREVLVARLQAVEEQIAATRVQSGQVDQETRGRYESEHSRLRASEAAVAAAEVAMRQARADYDRAVELSAQKWISPQALDRARSTFEAAQENHRKAIAEVAAMRGSLTAAGGSRRQVQVMDRQAQVLARQAAEIRAEIRRRDIDIADRTLESPVDGRVVMTFVRAGEHVAAGQRILMFHDPERIWVEANVKETDVGRISPGMRASIRVDAYPDKPIEGEVFRIGRAATSKFALLPDPNPSGNFTKITQRLPVRILLREKDPALRPGMMVEVRIALGDD